MRLDSVFQESSVAARIHPSILQLGLKYADGSIAGGNARCLAMLLAFKTVIEVSHRCQQACDSYCRNTRHTLC